MRSEVSGSMASALLGLQCGTPDSGPATVALAQARHKRRRCLDRQRSRGRIPGRGFVESVLAYKDKARPAAISTPRIGRVDFQRLCQRPDASSNRTRKKFISPILFVDPSALGSVHLSESGTASRRRLLEDLDRFLVLSPRRHRLRRADTGVAANRGSGARRAASGIPPPAQVAPSGTCRASPETRPSCRSRLRKDRQKVSSAFSKPGSRVWTRLRTSAKFSRTSSAVTPSSAGSPSGWQGCGDKPARLRQTFPRARSILARLMRLGIRLVMPYADGALENRQRLAGGGSASANFC